MAMSYSSTSGGTLTLPSPTNVHHVDVGSAVRSLRRSLSRSPSKLQLVRTSSQGSDGSTISQNAASPESPCPRPSQMADVAIPAFISSSTPPQQTTPFATPFRSSVKLSLRSARPKATSTKPISRPRPSPKSPLKRALSITSDSGNSAPATSSSEPLVGQENNTFNRFALAFSPAPRANFEKPSRHSMHLDLSGASKTSARFLDMKGDSLPTSTASPMKRSDAIMDFDQTSLGSPVAKRRSLHGISSFGSDFNIFDQASSAQPNFEIHDDTNQEYQLTGSVPPSHRESAPSPTTAFPKRSTSLRKSTLQQRHDPRSSWGRRQGEKYLAQQTNDISTPVNTRNKPRLSLDQFLQPDPRESPFTTRGPLPNPSVHAMERPAHQPHPLSRSLTTSSSSSSLPDDSPTHVPVQYGPDRPRPAQNFAKSLPYGAQRPKEPVATPSYKSAKPFQAAFASTGLVSKMNRNPEQDPTLRTGTKALIMPDTPCKKQVYPSATYPPSAGSGRKERHSLGAPATPFNGTPQQSRGTFGNSDKMGGLFKLRTGHVRRSSLLSLDGDADNDLPPTPTKSILAKKFGSAGQVQDTPVAVRTLPPPTSATGLGTDCQVADPTCKSSPIQKSMASREFEHDTQVGAPDIPACSTRRSFSNLSTSLSSFSRSRALHGSFSTPEPLKTVAVPPLMSELKENGFAKFDFLIPASPLDRLGNGRDSPKTPQDVPAQLDASGLSISNSQDISGSKQKAGYPPATPTAGRESFGVSADRRASITPVHGQGPSDVDESLVLRFDKVECIGRGEFSQVFRVAMTSPTRSLSEFGATPGRAAPSHLPVERVFAVKKIRLPFHGQRDREMKLREVSALRAVRGQQNVLQYVGHWEQNYHLYIQTEYCDEGSLDGFLNEIGDHGRLDDFRIWKILLEVTQGLQYVHAADFVHLDLKPANILITYDGSLKIGDFGMATSLPAPRGIEGEGDRQYMAPEVLHGKLGTSADIFSLGLIALETACNVVLPENGPTWRAIREGNMSTVPSLTLTANESKAIRRDATGMPISNGTTPYDDSAGLNYSKSEGLPFEYSAYPTHNASNLFGSARRSDLEQPPGFMVDSQHRGSLDSVIRWMLSPRAKQRPTAEQILGFDSIQWVDARRRAAATVFEGNWGPADRISEPAIAHSDFDTEMTDV